MEAEHLLALVRGSLSARAAAAAISAPLLAPDFNVVDIIAPDENKLSALFAMLLDPRGSHGQGDLFLCLFLEQLGFAASLANGAVIETEAATDRIIQSRRRVDILARSPGLWLGIENKPWAGDQPRQCADYIAHLRAGAGERFCLVYLSPTGAPPSPKSFPEADRLGLEAKGQFKAMGYRELLAWLERCRQTCQADRLRPFLSDLIAHIRRTVLRIPNMAETSHIVDLALKDPSNLEAMMAIARAERETKVRILNIFLEQITAFCDGRGFSLRSTLNAEDPSSGIFIRFAKDHVYGPAFQFTKLGFCGLVYGLNKDTPSLSPLPSVHGTLSSAFGNAKSTNWYVWQRPAGPGDALLKTSWEWNGGHTAWQAMLDHRATDAVSAAVLAMHDALLNAKAMDDLKTPA